MTTDEVLTVAMELIRQAKKHMDTGESAPDPVRQRRELARAASRLRTAADHLDALKARVDELEAERAQAFAQLQEVLG